MLRNSPAYSVVCRAHKCLDNELAGKSAESTILVRAMPGKGPPVLLQELPLRQALRGNAPQAQPGWNSALSNQNVA
jgi:hypothetical protein